MPWLRRTGQVWKLLVVWVGMLPGALVFFTPWFRDFRWAFFSLAVFAWFMAAVRCPRCGRRVAWYAATSVHARDFDRTLFGLERCPLCNDGIEQPMPPPPLFSAYKKM
jgi:hypothetical protein